MELAYSLWFYLLMVFCTSKVRTDLSNVTELIAETEKLIAGFVSYEPATNNNAYFENITSNASIEYGTFDFIIVGGGTAGLVLANRLIQEQHSVLVIEAGDEDPDVSAFLFWFVYYTNPNEYSWWYTTTEQKNSCLVTNGTCAYSRGKVLGGSSSTNAGIYARGNPRDYDIWEELGNSGWSYDDVLPYFKKSESARFNSPIDSDYHGFSGLQGIDISQDTANLTTVILDAFNEMGSNELDYNGYQQIGYSRTQNYLDVNIRSSSNYSFLPDIINSSNLNITLQSLVIKVIIENDTAIGVKFVKNGQYYIANASKEVILSAGSIGTPQILMLSGIGPASELDDLDIEVAADLPVGKYFQDHMFFEYVFYLTAEPFFNESLEELVELWTQNEGPLTSINQAIIFLDFDNDTVPEIEIFSSIGFYSDDNDDIYSTYFVVTTSLLHPVSVGELTLASADPRDYPLIDPNFLSEEEDIENIYKGIQFAISLNNTEAFQEANFQLALPSIDACDDEYENLSKDWWYCIIKQYAVSGYHPIRTANMGSNSTNSVVDSNLKVHGIENLRVVDASVMPAHVSGHTNAAVVMIAEKIADVIISDYT